MSARNTTAHTLSADLRNGEVPTDPAVLADFGFDECFSAPDRARLSMVYHLLMVDLEVRPSTMNKWKAKGAAFLADKMRAAFADAKPDRARAAARAAAYVAWFQAHQYIWDPNDVKGRRVARAEARKMIKRNMDRQKKQKKEAFDWWS